jgi:hypothetical protein
VSWLSLLLQSNRPAAKVPSEQEKDELESFEHQMVLDGNTQTAGLIVDHIQRSQLLARETSELRFMTNMVGMRSMLIFQFTNVGSKGIGFGG